MGYVLHYIKFVLYIIISEFMYRWITCSPQTPLINYLHRSRLPIPVVFLPEINFLINNFHYFMIIARLHVSLKPKHTWANWYVKIMIKFFISHIYLYSHSWTCASTIGFIHICKKTTSYFVRSNLYKNYTRSIAYNLHLCKSYTNYSFWDQI